MDKRFSRSRMLLGDEAAERMAATRVIVFGVGGVGSWAAETLVRTGIGHLTLVDFDTVAPSNINRQLPALTSTVGTKKAQAMRNHLLDINPDAEIIAIDDRYTADTADSFQLDDFDYAVDAIDSLRDKALLINNATRSRCRLVSSMGAALKTDPQRVKVAEFWSAKGCRLAAALRRYFKKSDTKPARKFKVVYSDEITENRTTAPEEKANGSLMQVTAVFGINLASLIINDIANKA